LTKINSFNLRSPHNEGGIVYVSEDHIKQRQFVKNELLSAKKEL